MTTKSVSNGTPNAVNNPALMPTQTQNAKANKKVEGVDDANAKPANPNRAQAEKNFNVELSAKAREMQEGRAKALEIARNTPDVREDRVADIKRRIADGTYQVDAGAVADGMLREAIKDKLSTEAE